MLRSGLTIAALLALAACNSNAKNEHVESDPVPQWGDIDIQTIPLNENDPGAKVSTSRNFYFIFDGSGSMSDPLDEDCVGQTEFPTKLAGAQWAITEFLGKVPEDINIGLLVFDNNGVREEVALGKDNREAFLQAIEGVRAGDRTPLAAAIQTATDKLIQQYKKQLGYGEFRIVVVTDGIANRIPLAAEYAMGYGFPIYAIGLCIQQNHPLRKYALSYRAADNFDDLARGLEETLAELPAFDVQTFDESP